MPSLGLLSLAVAIYRGRVLSSKLTWVVIAAIVGAVLSFLIESTWSGHVFSAAVIVASWPLAYRMWVDTTEAPAVFAVPPAPS